MPRVSRCIDNGPMEAFWGMLKSKPTPNQLTINKLKKNQLKGAGEKPPAARIA